MSAMGKGPKTVLVVEDNPDDLCLFQLAVRKAECRLTFRYVSNAEEAIAYMKGKFPFEDRKAHPFPDLMVLDLNLPKMDGCELLEWVRTTPGCRDIKVAVWSGEEDPKRAERARKAGAALFLGKPLAMHELPPLIAKVKRLVGGREPSEPMPE